MEMILTMMAVTILIFWTVVGAILLVKAIRKSLAEQRAYDEEYDRFIKSLAAIDNMYNMFGEKAFKKFDS